MDLSLECLYDEEKREENQIRCLLKMINLRSSHSPPLPSSGTLNLCENVADTHEEVILFASSWRTLSYLPICASKENEMNEKSVLEQYFEWKLFGDQPELAVS